MAIPMDKLKEALEGYDLTPDTVDAIISLDEPDEPVDIDAIKKEVREEVEAEWQIRYREAFFKSADAIGDAFSKTAVKIVEADDEATLSFDELIYGKED